MWKMVVVFQTRESNFIILPLVGHAANDVLLKVGYKLQLFFDTWFCCRQNQACCCFVIPYEIGKVSGEEVCPCWELHNEGLQWKTLQNIKRNPTIQLLHKKFMPFCCFHGWISSEVPVAASWKKADEERSLLSVLGRITNVSLGESLRRGHQLI